LTTSSQLKDPYLHDVVEQAYPFLPDNRNKLKEAISHLVSLYAKCVTKGDVSTAHKQLRVHQREQIAWERDTVWRQMIGKERRGESDGQAKSLGEVDGDAATPGAPSSNWTLRTPFGPLKFKKKKIFLPIAVAVFIALLKSNVVAGVEANNCFAILIFATLLWATEVGVL
jgi:phosphate transporter